MYIQQNISKGKGEKSYKSALLCHKYREAGKIKTKVLANLSMLDDEALLGLKNALNKNSGASVLVKDILPKRSIDYGFISVLMILMEKLRISDLFEKIMPQHVSIIKLLIIGKIVTRGSKLSIFNWIQRNQEIAEMLGLDLKSLKLEEIYHSLALLPQYQQKIDKKWAVYHKTSEKQVFLYDITSSYFEGVKNVLAEFGYNRDNKKGKMQINIGLITDANGFPLKIEVFNGNINDYKTVASQLQVLKSDFNAQQLIFVGDRGMKIKYNLDKMEECEKQGIDYITGLTKDEIKNLINNEVIQLDLFSEQLAEVIDGDQRYVLSVNPELTSQSRKFRMIMREKFETEIIKIQASYQKMSDKFQTNKEKIKSGSKNKKLVVQFTEKQIDSYKKRTFEILKKYQVNSFYTLSIDYQQFKIDFDLVKYNNDSKLDGLYVITTTVKSDKMTKEVVKEHYKKLQNVEHAFRDMKTCCLDVRPIFHVNEATTRGHILITMFSYSIIHQLENKIFPFLKTWNKENKKQYSFQDITGELKDIKLVDLKLGNQCHKLKITELTKIQKQILQILEIDEKQLSKFIL
jgi:transposase